MGKRTFNKPLLSATAIALACMLAACGGGGEDPDSTAAPQAAAQQDDNNDGAGTGVVVLGQGARGDAAAAEPGATALAAAPGTIVVRASGSLAKNVGPVMQLLVNGVAYGRIEVRSPSYADYSFNVGSVAADAKVEVVFNNDWFANGEDRNLFVESITVNGTTIPSTDPSVRFDRGRDAQAFDNIDVLPGLSTLWWNGALRFKAPAPPAGKVTLAIENGAYPTNRSITLSPDRLSVAFGNGLNPDCENRVGIYASADFAGAACHKRAVRASGGIKKGEFRYYEGRRLFGQSNIGFGYITAASAIDPYCCFVDPGQPVSPRTPPSMSINAVGGVTVRLSVVGGYYADLTSYYGFAVDYTGAEPVVYTVTTAPGNTLLVSRYPTPGFNGVDVIPFVYGHTYLADTPTTMVASVNFGQQPFHYDLAAVRSELALQGANVSKFVPGVGAP